MKDEPKAEKKEEKAKDCDMCWGTGVDEGPNDPCIYCKGSGNYEDKVVEGEEASVETPETPEKEE